MLRLVLLACTLLSWCKADLTFSATNAMLDPNRITWWRSKWAPAPITLSRNNRSSPVTVTFYISPTTSITNGIFEVTFPANFVLTAGANVSGQTQQVGPVTYVGGQDYAQIVTGITTPSTVGSYGPFSLRTRYNSLGQQVDVNLNFGCVYIYGDAGTLGSLSVLVVGAPNTGTIINRSGNTLSFKFTIAVSLWRYDTFIITADPRWTIASGASCSSADYAGRYNNFNGTNSANHHSLQCVVTQLSTTNEKQQVFIYGLAVDGVDIATTDNQYVDLRVTSVISPNSVYPGSAYAWTVATNRFGTTTILETSSYNAGPLVINDVITTVSWTPTWGSTASNLVGTQSVFMDLTFTLTNAIPAITAYPNASGYITITVTERLNDGSTAIANWAPGMTVTSNCYVVTYLGRTVDCTTPTTSSYLLTGLPTLAAGTSIKIRSVVYISTSTGNAQVSSINTFQGVAGASTGGYPIDIATNQASFAIAAATSIVTTTAFSWNYHLVAATSVTAGGKYTAGILQDYNLQFIINTPIAITAASTFTINCPLSSTADDLSIGLPSPAYFFESTTATAALAAVAGTFTTTPVFTVGTSGASLGSFTFTAAHNLAVYGAFSRFYIIKAAS